MVPSPSKAQGNSLEIQRLALQDLRNHGHSFHSTEHNYGVMAEDVEKFIQQQKLDKCVLIGHSMCVSFCFIKGKKPP